MHDERSRAPAFSTTLWSVVVAAGNDDQGGRDALAQLCAAYWYPLYAFVRCRGWNGDDAADLTQAFFARLLERRDIADADRAKGRFRSFLLAALSHFLADERDRRSAIKRGGGVSIISIDAERAAERWAAEPACGDTPERAFERAWAIETVDRARARLEAEYALAGEASVFAALQDGLVRGGPRTHAERAAALGKREGAVRVALHRLRRRWRDVLYDEVRSTTRNSAEADAEIAALFEALAS